jgi:hypothetical protein
MPRLKTPILAEPSTPGEAALQLRPPIAAYRRWYAEQMEDHDRTMLHMMAEFERRGGGRGR